MSQQNKQTPLPSANGQALVEYSLIIVLVILGFGLALAATGPTIANVFSNTVFNLVSRENDKIPLNAEGTRISPPEVAAFWETVTAVAKFIPVEVPLPTSSRQPPTNTPTPGPPPPPTNVPPPTPITPTLPPSPTPTQSDFAVKAPWTDTANDKIYWRLDEIDPLGSTDWYGTYYSDKYLSGAKFMEGFNGNLDPAQKQVINYNWGNNSPKANGPTDNFSVTWERKITLDKTMQLGFSSSLVDDGLRIWILGGAFGGSAPGCTAMPSGNGAQKRYGDSDLGYDAATGPVSAIPKECLIYENWQNSGGVGTYLSGGFGEITRTIPAGSYTIRVDYQEGSGDAGAKVAISSKTNHANPDDVLIDTSGNPIAGASGNCDWGNPTGLEKFADTADKLWTANKTSNDSPNFVGQRRCFLEFRGSIEILPTITNPTLTFWDLWDFPASTTSWVEVSEYKLDGQGKFDRSLLVWERFPLHSSDSFNYNWTYQTVLLGPKYSGKKIALRFGLENRSSSAKSRWWIDTIAITSVTRSDLYMAKTWNFDSKNEAKDFITTGSWGLTTENMIGGTGFGWHESAGGNYTSMNYKRPSLPPATTNNFRVHSLEFNGVIDLDNPLGQTDQDTDSGDPELTFYQTYDLANYTGLEVQYAPVTDVTQAYTAGNGPTWTTFTGSTIVTRAGSVPASLVVAEQRRINLKPIADAGFTKFRLRFAMLVDKDSTANKSGWWIDKIRLERVDKPRYSPYPFYDNVETDTSDNKWLSLGSWAREAGGHQPPAGKQGFSFTDSPGTNYSDNDTTVLELRFPMDLRADTLNNPRSPLCNLGSICNPADKQDKAAVDPMLSFWWKRELNSGEDFYVEWKLKSETTWRPVLWAYNDGSQTIGTGTLPATRDSRAWERAEVNMKPVMAAIGVDVVGNDSEDDIVMRFRFVTNSANNAAGIWIDDIEIAERNEQVWRLWPTSETRLDTAGVVLPKGNGLQYVNSGEDLEVAPPEWYVGGNWEAISWETHDGINAFHDSVVNSTVTQSSAETAGAGDNLASTITNTFNVLELNKVFDLRGVLSSERPLMYFWHRYSVPSGGSISVQVAKERTVLPVTGPCKNSYQQCYEKLYMWNEWETVWKITGEKANLAWNREQVNLAAFAKNGLTPGSRIRIRFVMDALDATNSRDGWYLDQFTVMHYGERRITISPSNSFVDNSTDMTNWIDEGKWGLDPEVFKGGGGIPISIGDFWSVNYWSFAGTTICANLGVSTTSFTNTKFSDCVNRFFTPGGNDTLRAKSSVYRPNTTGITPTVPNRTEIDIYHEWGNSGPTNGATTYSDQFAGRWELVTNIIGSPGAPKGKITFIMASDEGARLKYMNQNASSVSITNACQGLTPTCGFSTANPTGIDNWNIIDHWAPHGRSVTVGAAILSAAGAGGNNNTTGKYRFILEYYDYSGSAVLTLATGTDTFSFSDTPKQGAGSGFADIPAIRKASSSLLLRGVLDLTNAVRPYLTYYTVHEMGGTARVEVSTDGGFNWTESGLRGNVNNKWVNGPTGTWQVELWEKNAAGVFGNTSLDFYVSGSKPAPTVTTTTTNINYNWSGAAFTGTAADNFSVRFTRKINLLTSDELKLRTVADDGVRLWIYKDGAGLLTPQSLPNGCPTVSPVGYMRSGQPRTNNGNAKFTASCLLIDNWQNQGPLAIDTLFSPTSSGVYVIQLDYYEATGGAQLSLEVSPNDFDLPSFGGTSMDTANWVRKVHDLSAYQGQRIGLRFRLDRLGTTSTNSSTASNAPYGDSWWLTEIGVFSN